MWHYGAIVCLCESSLKEHIKAFRTRDFLAGSYRTERSGCQKPPFDLAARAVSRNQVAETVCGIRHEDQQLWRSKWALLKHWQNHTAKLHFWHWARNNHYSPNSMTYYLEGNKTLISELENLLSGKLYKSNNKQCEPSSAWHNLKANKTRISILSHNRCNFDQLYSKVFLV